MLRGNKLLLFFLSLSPPPLSVSPPGKEEKAFSRRFVDVSMYHMDIGRPKTADGHSISLDPIFW